MTEPVAYVKIKDGKVYSMLRTATPNDEYMPVYTSDQLHPRVKMTQAEFDEWKELYYRLNEFSFNVHRMLDEILGSIGVERGIYTKLAKRVYQDDDFMAISKKQSELINLFINYSPDTPEETIDIIPDMKWFVRSKKSTTKCEFRWLDNNQSDNIVPTYSLSVRPFNSRAFDTKEEAQKWTNPLTEAVQLPVEDE